MGAIICREILQMMDDHRAVQVIFIAGALGGVYGRSGPFMRWFPNIAIEEIYLFAYNGWIQKHISLANLWHDPGHEDNYINGNEIIPALDGYQLSRNNETDIELEENWKSRVRTYNKNFQRLKNVYCFGSEADQIVVPWQTEHFGFYKNGSTTEMEPYCERLVSETLGLDKMNKDGRLHLIHVTGIRHTDWLHRRDIVRKHLLKPLARYPKIDIRKKITNYHKINETETIVG